MGSGLNAFGRMLRDTPGAFRARLRNQGLQGTVQAIPQMIRFARMHYFGASSAPRVVSASPTPAVAVPAPVGDSRRLDCPHAYAAWLARHAFTPQRRQELVQRLASAQKLPRISVVMPVYNAPERWLNRAIESVQEQVYGDWELCIADDASPKPHVRAILERWERADSRIRIVYRPVNGGISLATNSAADLATGEFLAFMDHDDEISPDCLAEIALRLAAEPAADVLYTDDDKINEAGVRYDPQFKASYSPELLLGYMYFCHMMVVRRTVFADVGGMRVGFEGSQDHDLALRTTERARCVLHLPKVLYHWRAIPGSTALSTDQKKQCMAATRRCVQSTLDRRNCKAIVVHPEWSAQLGLGDCTCEFPDTGPSVSLIIPTRNRLDLLRTCIDSLAMTTYRNYRIVIVDNVSDDPATLQYLKSLPAQVLRIDSPDGKFNFSYLNNRAIEQVDSEYVLLLNNDTEVIEPRWLSRMMGYAQLPGVGSVGARLLYPDGRVQHAGILQIADGNVPSPEFLPWHIFKYASPTEYGYMRLSLTTRNVAAVTAACMLTPRELYLEVGGLNETEFRVAFNDVDYGYRLTMAGHRSIYCATAVLRHHESVSRGYDGDPREVQSVRSKYGGWPDPFISPHLKIRDHELVFGT